MLFFFGGGGVGGEEVGLGRDISHSENAHCDILFECITEVLLVTSHNLSS